MALSNWADWWDKQRQQSMAILDDWVRDNPQWWTVGIATSVATAMDLGQGVVDVLRFGEGAAQGGGAGYGKDALRLLVILGPLGRAGAFVSRFASTSMIRLAVATEGVTGPCTFTALNNAMTIVAARARNLILTAREAAKALGKPLSCFAKVGGEYDIAAWIDELVPFLRTQGARVKAVSSISNIEDVIQLATKENGVVIFAVKWTSRVGGKIERSLHSLIAVRDAVGRVRFADYGGKFMNSVSELAARGGTWVPDAAGFQLVAQSGGAGAHVVGGPLLTGLMENALTVMKGGILVIQGVTAVETKEEGVDLGVPVTISANYHGSDAPPPELAKASFEAFKARKEGKPVIKLPLINFRGNRNGPPRSDWLTGVQYRLNALGFGAGPVDGINGPKTKRAVREFQKTYKLGVDGIPGPKTQGKLVEVCGF